MTSDPVLPVTHWSFKFCVGAVPGKLNAAVKLLHAGFAEKLVFSGFEVSPGKNSSTAMKEFALNFGVPESSIITESTDEEVSTKGESIANLKLLKKHNIKRFILLTSDFHTRRSRLIYKKMTSLYGYDVDFSIHPVIDPEYPKQGWWNLWRARRWIFFEYIKIIGFYFDV